MVNGDFTINVINPTDSVATTPAVSESVQLPGLYYFDIPASFLTAQGIGDYGVSIRIDSISGPSGAPNVRSAEASVLHVTQQDWDSLSGSLTSNIVSGVWNANAATFNSTGSMGFLQNLIIQVSGNTNANVIASNVWNAVAASYNVSGTFGWLANQHFESSSVTPTVNNIVSGVWNANTTTFNAAGTFGAAVNEILQDVKFHMSSTLVASGSVITGTFDHLSTSVGGNVNQYNGMLLLLKSVLSGNQTRVIDTFRTGTFDVDPGFEFGAPGDAVFVLSTQFVPSYGNVG